MRSFVCLVLGMAVLAGCATPKNNVNGTKGGNSQNKTHEKISITPEPTLVGSVVRVNETPRFAVLNFPVGSLPGLGMQMNVYRQSVKIGAIKITGPQLDDNIIADVTEGSVQVGDQIRGN